MRYWLQISSGRGPEECCWVVAGLVRYLMQTAVKENFTAEILESVPGQDASTMRSALLAVEGDDRLPGFINDWQGTVQWIGTSVLRPTHKRKNWFVTVNTFEPVSQDKIDLKDIRIETMRSTGPGGQHVNKTESAVRVTDRATGLSAVAREERSQYLNRKLAIARLKQLLENRTEESQSKFAQTRWEQHNSLERGNATHVFSGPSFKLER